MISGFWFPRKGAGADNGDQNTAGACPKAGGQAGPLIDEAGDKGAKESATGIRHVVESDVEGGFVRVGIGEDEVGVESGVHGEDDAKNDESSQDGRDEMEFCLYSEGEKSADHGENDAPDECRLSGMRDAAFVLTDELWGRGLDDPVTDDPDGHEGTDGNVTPAQNAAEKDGESDDKPDIT